MAEYTCRVCGVVKTLVEFPANRFKKRGHETICKPCKTVEGRSQAARRRLRYVGPLVTERECNSCRKVPPASEFGIDKGSKWGIRYDCKSCLRSAARATYADKNKVRMDEAKRLREERRRELEHKTQERTRLRAEERRRRAERPHRCPDCGSTDPGEFRVRRDGPTQRSQTYCKGCTALRQREWRRVNVERLRERDRLVRAENVEAARAKSRRYHELNKARLNEGRRLRRLAALDHERERVKRYRLDHLAEDAETVRRRYAKKRSVAIGTVTVKSIEQRMSVWGNKCWMCGGPFENVDHVKPLAAGGAHCLANLRPACKRCNCTKSSKWPWPTSRRDYPAYNPLAGRMLP